MDDYKTYKNVKPIHPKKGRPSLYWDRMMDCEDVDNAFFVERTLATMTTNVWRYNQRLIKMNSDWRFKAFNDTEFVCDDCGCQQLLSQLKSGNHCIKCNETKLTLVRKGCTIQRIS